MDDPNFEIKMFCKAITIVSGTADTNIELRDTSSTGNLIEWNYISVVSVGDPDVIYHVYARNGTANEEYNSTRALSATNSTSTGGQGLGGVGDEMLEFQRPGDKGYAQLTIANFGGSLAENTFIIQYGNVRRRNFQRAFTADAGD